jgi:hypothetical protein
MIQDIRHHSTDYAILAAYLGIMLLAFILNVGKQAAQGTILVVTGIGYVLWGLWHHYQTKDLSAKIVAEYVLMAILIITVLTTVLLSR